MHVPNADVHDVTAASSAEDEADALGDGRTRHDTLLIAAPISAGQLGALKKLLFEMAHPAKPLDLETNPVLPFGQLKGVHFARILTLPESHQPPGAPSPGRGDYTPAQLLFATDFDGSLPDHLRDLIRVGGDGLDRLFGHCDGWPRIGNRDREGSYLAFADFVARHAIPANTFFTGTVRRTVSQIRREAALRDAIDGFLDQHIEAGMLPQSARQTRELVREWVFRQPHLAWVHTRPAPPPGTLPRWVKNHLDKVLVGLVALFVAAAAFIVSRLIPLSWTETWALVIGAWFTLGAVGAAAAGAINYLSARDPFIIRPNVQDRIAELVKYEDFITQNQMSAVNYIKRPLWFRRMVLRLVLAGVNLAARFTENQGSLSGIPSIHFARWVIIDKGRRLLFFSNFGGSWESYLGDFVDKAHLGLTAIWSNCVGFPRTRGLRGEGALNEQWFKTFARDSQIVTDVWYSAYRWLTVTNINDNTRLRLGLYPEMNEPRAAAWLRMAMPREQGSRKLPPVTHGPVAVADVQGLVVRSYPGLPAAVYMPLAFADADGARHWLDRLLARLTPASLENDAVTARGEARNVAFTRQGLAALGLTASAVSGFSREFNEGMAGSAHRKRLLNDVGEADPDRWEWGGPHNPPVHAVLFLFARDADLLSAILKKEEDDAGRHGVTFHPPLTTVTLEGRKEHFGFQDGIAQPHVQGVGTAASAKTDVIPAGEVVLGYRNAYGRMPISPTVKSGPASDRHLPKAEPDEAGLSLDRDFGRHGSYVVFRQLQQDVKAFWQDVNERAGGCPETRKSLAAKMVGRWPNGAPLARFDDEPSELTPQSADEFLYEQDLDGNRCPVGAHIRRTNPRDGLGPDRHESQIVANRHRLIRRGRAYGDPLSRTFDPDEIVQSADDDRRRGLHFICFNTDISRQFEFVQSAWMNNPKFDGLYGDPDAVVAPHRRARPKHPAEASCFTVQRAPVRQRYRDLKQFVTTVGGCYLFMPGFAAMRYLVDLSAEVAAAGSPSDGADRNSISTRLTSAGASL